MSAGGVIAEAQAERAASAERHSPRARPSPRTRASLWRKVGIVVRGLRRSAWRRRGSFALGCAAALVVVGARLALPWPLRVLADLWMVRHHSAGAFVPFRDHLGPLSLGVAFLALSLVLGFADHFERLAFAKFSNGLAKSLRRKVVVAATRLEGTDRALQAGELIASMFGDSARFKNGLRGLLVHGATNGALFLGVTVILCTLSRTLGTIFAIAGLLIAITSFWSAARLFQVALKQRRRDGDEANQIHAAMQVPGALERRARQPRAAGARDVEQTRIQGVTTWIAHGVFGLAVLVSLSFGSHEIARGELAPGDMIVFVLYALMMRGPAVRVARQGARTGAILGSAYRLIRIIKLGRRMARHRAVQAEGEPHGLPALEMR